MRKILLFLLISFSCAQANTVSSILTDISNAAQETATSFKETTTDWASYFWKSHPLLMTGGAITGALAGAHMLLKDGLYYTFCSDETLYDDATEQFYKISQEFCIIFTITNNKKDNNEELLKEVRYLYDNAYPFISCHNHIDERRKTLKKYAGLLSRREGYSFYILRSNIQSLDNKLAVLDRLIKGLPEYSYEKLNKDQADKLDALQTQVMLNNLKSNTHYQTTVIYRS